VARKGGLGRGLTALIPQVPEGQDGTTGSVAGLREIPVHELEANRLQPRKSFDEESLEDLASSIKELGILQPLLVREVPGGGFELIAGERRLRAAKRAGLASVPVVVRSADDHASLEQALVENLHRQDLNPLEEAAAYQRLIEEFGYTQEQVAQRVGRSRSAVANLLRLFQLTPAVQHLVGEGLLSAGHAKALLAHPDRALQEELAKQAVRETLSVRQVEELVRERLALDQASDEGSDDPGPSGKDEEPRAERPSEKLRPPGLLELEELLADHLDTRVAIAMSTKNGRVTIDFADLEDLERIYRRIISA
jgi:ParB family chromosome partitioning protein